MTPIQSRRRWGWAGVMALVLVLISAGVVLLRKSGLAGPEGDPRRVLVAPLQNRTGDSRFDALGELTADWITDALVRSNVANVVDQVTALYVARDLGLDRQDATPDQLVLLRDATRSGRMVTGAIDGAGDSVAFFVKVTDLGENRVEGTVRVVVPVEEASTAGVREVAERLAGLLGVEMDPMLRSTGAGAMAPPRLEAYQQFLRGMDHWERGEDRDAFDAFARAAQADTNFVLPIVWARYTAGSGMAAPRRDSIAGVAARLLQVRRDRLTPLEYQALLSISPMADSNLNVQLDALRGAAELAPGSRYAHYAAQRLLLQLRLPEAVKHWATIDHKVGWARHDVPSRYGLAIALFLSGEYQRGLQVVDEALKERPDPAAGWFGLKARLLARLGRQVELDSLVSGSAQAAEATGTAEPFRIVMQDLFWELDCMGQADNADRVMNRLDQWLVNRSLPAVREPMIDSLLAAERHGDWHAAERAARSVLTSDSLPTAARNAYLGRLGVALALQGRVDEAKDISSQLAERPPVNPLTVNAQRARIAAALGEGDSAVALIRLAVASPSASTIVSASAIAWTRGPEWRPIRNHPGYRALVGSACVP
jgi:tetratricopeptide (TPR) repeat protein